MERQLKNQLSDLANMEDRVSKSAAEKGKLETKYYAAMRDKDAIENERKNLARTVEKQGKAVDRLTDAEKQYKNQISVLEKENAGWKKYTDTLKEKVYILEKENPELLARIEQDRKRYLEASQLFQDREHTLACKKQDLRIKEDETIRIKIEMEKELALVKKKSDLSTRKLEPGSSEMESLRKLVMCSTCKDTARSTIITKCMHTFCKPCVDVRLATRQRKCPYCNLAFGQSDVHTFFFQG
jgi:E3 ubiquitin-protein ligase BRE1